MRRLVIESDYHCGSQVGLVPPKHWQGGKRGEHQKELWNFRKKVLKSLQPIDFLVVNGDCIDGKGEASGGTELITTDRHKQAAWAAEAIDLVKANECGLIYGTAYHTGKTEDFEDAVASICKTPKAFVSGQEFFKYHGVTFDFKHFVGASGIPHGRHTAIAKEKLWNLIWADRGGQPKVDYVVRSHVHYHSGVFDRFYTGFTTPCWQGHGSKFGVRKCAGTVDIGLMVLEFGKKGVVDACYGIFADLEQQVARVTVR